MCSTVSIWGTIPTAPKYVTSHRRESLDEIRRIFDRTGGTALHERIEVFRRGRRPVAGMAEVVDGKPRATDEYLNEVYTVDSGVHTL